MKVAWITTGFLKDESEYDGAAFLHNLAKEISNSHEIDLKIFPLYYPIGEGEYSFYNAKVFLCRNNGVKSTKVSKIDKIRSILRCLSKFKTEHLKENFDVIHSIWSGESGFVASYLSKKYNIALITSIGGGELGEIPEIGYGSRLKFWQKRFVGRTFKTAKAIVTGSEYITNKIKQYYDVEISSKIIKIPFGVDEKRFYKLNEKIQRQKNKNIVLINIATAFPVKSHGDLFKALKIVREKYPDIVLKCYGRDDNNILNQLVKELNVEDNVELNGFIAYEKIPDALHNADIFVLSSLYESQNMAILEAAFCGLPVISTDVGAAPEVTPHVVKSGNYKALAEKILYVVENPNTAYQNLNEMFSLDSSISKFIGLYNSAAKKQLFHK